MGVGHPFLSIMDTWLATLTCILFVDFSLHNISFILISKHIDAGPGLKNQKKKKIQYYL